MPRREMSTNEAWRCLVCNVSAKNGVRGWTWHWLTTHTKTGDEYAADVQR